MENSKIEWTDHTFNPVTGCVKISEACKFCYAEATANRFHKDKKLWGPGSNRKPASEKYWNEPLKWNARCEKEGKKETVFCASMSDVFENHVDWVEPRRRLFELISKTPNLTWLLLTKRPENIVQLVRESWPASEILPKNILFGCSIENQQRYDQRWSWMNTVKNVSGMKIFYSMEPLLGSVNFHINEQVDWVIVGGESGAKARKQDIIHFAEIHNQCLVREIPFFMKQVGKELGKEFEMSGGKGAELDKLPDEYSFLNKKEFPIFEPLSSHVGFDN